MWVQDLESSRNLSPAARRVSLEMAPLLQIELFGLWQSHESTFRMVIISIQLPINAELTMTHVDPYF